MEKLVRVSFGARTLSYTSHERCKTKQRYVRCIDEAREARGLESIDLRRGYPWCWLPRVSGTVSASADLRKHVGVVCAFGKNDDREEGYSSNDADNNDEVYFGNQNDADEDGRNVMENNEDESKKNEVSDRSQDENPEDSESQIEEFSSGYDIDILASQLAAEAGKMRLQSDRSDEDTANEEAGFAPDEEPLPKDSIPNFSSAQSTEPKESGEKDMNVLLRLIGDGGFSSSDFELLRELGSLSIQEIETSMGSSGAPVSERRERKAVIAYIASYFSGMPFQDPVAVLLKEYLPRSSDIACNELLVLNHLTGMPSVDQKWHSARALIASEPPVVELLGYFIAGPSERAVQSEPELGTYDEDNVPAAAWIVQKWQDMAPLSLYPQAEQADSGLDRWFGGVESATRDRLCMIKAICKGILTSIGYCHDRQVVHGSLGSGCFLLSTFRDQEWPRLIVKIDNFGFSRHIKLLKNEDLGQSPDNSIPANQTKKGHGDDTPLDIGCREDLKQIAVVIMEIVLSSLSEDGVSQSTSSEAIQKLLGDVYDWDIYRYQEYVSGVPEWSLASELLSSDGDAGWDLLYALVSGNMTASHLALNKFCEI